MTGVLVRPAVPGEFDAIARLSLAAYEVDGQLEGGHGYERTLADVPARAAVGRILVAADEETGEVLGSVTLVLPGTRYAELSGPGEAEFRMLAVDPAAQGRGIGEALVRACLAQAEQLGCRAVMICTRRNFSAPAHRLYARLGFVRVPERDWSPAPGVELLALRLELAGQAAERSVSIGSRSS